MKPAHRYLASLLLAISSAPSVAAAQGVDTNRATARALAFEAQAALENKDYAAAAERFARADALVHAPTLLLGLARADVGLGNLVAAHDVYARIVREGAPPGSSAVFSRAVDDARAELDALETRMPRARLERKEPASPLIPPIAPIARIAPIVTPEPVTPARVTPPHPPDAVKLTAPPPARVSPRREAIKLVTLGVGGAALVTGTVTGILALGSEHELSARCPKTQCRPSERAAIDEYTKLRVVTLSTLITGTVLATTGALLALTAPRPRPREAYVRPMIGPGYIGLEGAF